MILTQDDQNLPKWVMDNIMTTCPYCGSPIASNHDTSVLTERWCSNASCPGHMAYRIVYIAKYYKVEGWGPATALDWVKNNIPMTPCEIIPTWFAEPPEETLSRITDLSCIPDFGITQAQKVLDKYASFEEYFASSEKNTFPILKEYEDQLLYNQQFFKVKKPITGRNLYVMATGSIHGYTNRDAFFDHLNDIVGDRVHIIQVGARKTNVTCLVKEEDAVDHRKSRIAQECGIPIYTSQEFMHIILKMYEQLGGDLNALQYKINKMKGD